MSKFVTLHGFGGSSGGTELNFEIIAYATEEELLADTPAENTIGVITDTPINGYRFSSTEPEGMDEGEVWIKIGTNSNIAFDVVDDITVYPLRTKQMISGILTDVIVKSYQNDEWVDLWNGVLLEPDNQYTEYTGGWVADTRLVTWTDSSKPLVAPTVTTDASSITITEPASQKQGCYRTVDKINLSDYKSLKLDIPSASTTNGHIRVSVINKLDVATNGNSAAFALIVDGSSPTTFSGTKTLDISTLSGEYYIAITFSTYQNQSASTIKLTKIYLE